MLLEESGDDTRDEVSRPGRQREEIEVENEEVDGEGGSGYDSDCIYLPPPLPQANRHSSVSSSSAAVGGKGLFAAVTSAGRIIDHSQVFDLT